MNSLISGPCFPFEFLHAEIIRYEKQREVSFPMYYKSNKIPSPYSRISLGIMFNNDFLSEIDNFCMILEVVNKIKVKF